MNKKFIGEFPECPFLEKSRPPDLPQKTLITVTPHHFQIPDFDPVGQASRLSLE
jgi:hypothetical protein